MIAIVLGPDHSMARTEVRRVLGLRDPDGQSTSWMDGQSSLRDVLMAVASVGFFSAGRAVVVEGLLARIAKSATKDSGDARDWAALIAGVPEASMLILLDRSISSVPAALKKPLPKDATVYVSDPPRGSDLLSWIRQRAQQARSEIDIRTARILAETLFPQGWSTRSNNPAFDRPPDLEMLGNEIDKLAVAAHPDAITSRQIADLTFHVQNDQVFRFIDAALSGNAAAAVTELDRLLSVGEDPHKLLAQVAQSAELGVVMAAAGRRAPAEVGKAIHLANANRMSAIARSLGNAGTNLPRHAIGVVESVDRQLKTGEIRDPVIALYAVITGIATKPQTTQ